MKTLTNKYFLGTTAEARRVFESEGNRAMVTLLRNFADYEILVIDLLSFSVKYFTDMEKAKKYFGAWS